MVADMGTWIFEGKTERKEEILREEDIRRRNGQRKLPSGESSRTSREPRARRYQVRSRRDTAGKKGRRACESVSEHPKRGEGRT